jgi:hypothetical protein
MPYRPFKALGVNLAIGSRTDPSCFPLPVRMAFDIRSAGIQVRFQDRLQHQLCGGLHHAIPNRKGCPVPVGARSPRSSVHPLPARPDWHAPVRRHGPECPLGRSCRTVGRSDSQVPASPSRIVSSEVPWFYLRNYPASSLSGALPRRVIPGPHWPSLQNGQIGIHNSPLEARSSFTLPSRTARQLPSHTVSSLGGSFPHW